MAVFVSLRLFISRSIWKAITRLTAPVSAEFSICASRGIEGTHSDLSASQWGFELDMNREK
jgi:hypothetical protein